MAIESSQSVGKALKEISKRIRDFDYFPEDEQQEKINKAIANLNEDEKKRYIELCMKYR